MIIFIRELFKKRTTKNYLLIISSLLIILTISISFKEYSFKLINNNYNGSYIYTKLNNNENIENLKNKNIYKIDKCIKSDEKLIITNDIKTIDAYKSVIKVSKEEFESMEFKNEYIIYLKNWTLYNEMIDYLINNGYEYDFYINKENELDLEKYYDYLYILIYILIFICFAIFGLSIYNFVIDENRNNYLFKVIGYNEKKIKNILFIKSFILLIIPILVNVILNIIITQLFNINNYLFYYIYTIEVLYTYLYEIIYIKLKGGVYNE